MIAILLYYFTIYYPVSVTRMNQYKYYYYVQELLYYYLLTEILLLLLKNYWYSTIAITKTIIQELYLNRMWRFDIRKSESQCR